MTDMEFVENYDDEYTSADYEIDRFIKHFGPDVTLGSVRSRIDAVQAELTAKREEDQRKWEAEQENRRTEVERARAARMRDGHTWASLTFVVASMTPGGIARVYCPICGLPKEDHPDGKE